MAKTKSEVVEEKVVEKKSLIAQLEEEGDVAADYLEGLLDIADLDGDIDIDVENDRAALAIVSPLAPSFLSSIKPLEAFFFCNSS